MVDAEGGPPYYILYNHVTITLLYTNQQYYYITNHFYSILYGQPTKPTNETNEPTILCP